MEDSKTLDGNREGRSDRRNLGDEWKNWDGRVEPDCNAGPDLFMNFVLLICFIFICVIYGLSWLISPRLRELGPMAYLAFMIFCAVFTIATVVWSLVFSFSVMREKLLFSGLMKGKTINFFLPVAKKFAGWTGVRVDRLGNSFLKVSNIWNFACIRQIPGEKLLLLLPRCLNASAIRRLKELKLQYNFETAVVGGGEEARHAVAEKSPEIVIAVACERDLVSGVCDVAERMPVLAFPNQRPEGPCRNTVVNLSELEGAIKKCVRTSAT